MYDRLIGIIIRTTNIGNNLVKNTFLYSSEDLFLIMYLKVNINKVNAIAPTAPKKPASLLLPYRANVESIKNTVKIIRTLKTTLKHSHHLFVTTYITSVKSLRINLKRIL